MKAFLIALSTLTLFPASPGKWSERDLKTSVAFYPLVGALLGGLLAALAQIHLSHPLKAILLLLLWIIGTGAFHLDGLADCCDGFFGGKDPQDRRRIMKDPFLGAYGVTAIGLALLAKFNLISNLLAGEDSWKWFLLIPVAGRWAVTLACTVFKAPPGDKGLGSQVMDLSPAIFAAATLLSLAAGIALLKLQGLEIFLVAGLAALGVGALSKSKIKGLTGDGMGATIELAEVAGLFFAVLNFHTGFFQL
jgi:adenosylcobinamide-GDP ribazoletransferase